MTQGTSHMRGKYNAQSEHLGADGGPVAADFDVNRCDLVAGFEEKIGPISPWLKLGGKRHQKQAQDSQRWGEQVGVWGQEQWVFGVVKFNEYDSRKDINANHCWRVGQVSRFSTCGCMILLTIAEFDAPIK